MSDTMVKGLVYGAKNEKTGMWYVGSTTLGIDYRRHHHYIDALKPNSKTRAHKFGSALLSTPESDWTWVVLEEADCSSQELLYLEGTYQTSFNSIDKGYNMVIAAVRPDSSINPDRRFKNAKEETKLDEDTRLRYNAYQREGNARRKAENPEDFKAKQRAYYLKARQDPHKVERMRESNRQSHARKMSLQRR